MPHPIRSPCIHLPNNRNQPSLLLTSFLACADPTATRVHPAVLFFKAARRCAKPLPPEITPGDVLVISAAVLGWIVNVVTVAAVVRLLPHCFDDVGTIVRSFLQLGNECLTYNSSI